jgi:hypothetical protein
LRADSEPEGEFLLAGFNPIMVTIQPAPRWLNTEVAGATNLVFYEQEVTGARVGTWVYLGQALRLLFYKPQMPIDSAGFVWLRSCANLLGTCRSVCFKTGAAALVADRTSRVGFNSIELHILADWLESPQFPRGFHTLLMPGGGKPWSHSSKGRPDAPATPPGH